MSDRETAIEALSQINPARLDYQDWLAVGMALNHAGASASDWEAWSRQDTRYKPGECERKWKGFHGSGGKPVTTGTLVQLARDQGGNVGYPAAREDRELDWDDVIGAHDDKPAVRLEWTQNHDMPDEPTAWKPAEELRRYLTTLFAAEEHVGYVTEAWKNEEGKHLPKRGNFDRTAGELIEELSKHGQELAFTIGDWPYECGAWIRFNPLDGKGCKDENVTNFRFALVESDSLPVPRQYDLYRELELPIAALVHSGGKSLHAIVRVDAPNMEEYRKRVDYLYGVCKRSGMEIDRQNRNPSRLSRLPGVKRNGKPQWLVSTNIGKPSWQEWRDWIEDMNDDLPDAECLADVWGNLPPLADEIISGVLRNGHKLLIAGPSKAGKSFLLLNLAVAIAEGRDWLGWQCKQGRVLYVNLELDRASCLHRCKALYDALGVAPKNVANIDIWNLRGKSMPMDKLAPKLIRRALKRKYLAVIIDPIYKVITGDENSASEMANFCNQFDRICAELGTATIYCHHHSKGSQGQKRAADRASGSGVFARDPDAALDLIELEVDDKRRAAIINRFACEEVVALLRELAPEWREKVSQDDAESLVRLKERLVAEFTPAVAEQCFTLANAVTERVTKLSAWRIEGVLREFPAFDAKQMFFDYPRHDLDAFDLLTDARAEGEEPPRRTRDDAIKEKQEDLANETMRAFEAVKGFSGDEPVTITALAEYLGKDETTVRRRLAKSGLSHKYGVVSVISKNQKD